MSPSAGPVADPRQILVIRRDNIGDLVCTTPLLEALRTRYPQAWIGVLANSYNAPALAGNPHVDAVLAYRKLKHLAKGEGVLQAVAQRIGLVWSLRRRGLDLVVLAAGEADRRGMAFARRLAPARILSAQGPREGQHEVERVFTAARALGIETAIPALTVRAAVGPLERVHAALEQAHLAGRHPLVGVHVSARRPRQRWPAERFAALCLALHARHGATIVLFWSPGPENHPRHPGDDGKAAELVAALAGRVPLLPYPTSELADLQGGLAACDLVVCADGGAMHLAAGLGKPVAALFGDSPAARWRPWGVPYRVLQPDSGDVRDLGVEPVLAACGELLAGG
jgi:heptosyltransferase-3